MSAMIAIIPPRVPDNSDYYGLKMYAELMGNHEKQRIKSLCDNKLEEPLPAGGSCLLGSINLAEFVRDDDFDFKAFIETVRMGVRALNAVLDEGRELHPLKEQRDSVRNWRQIGLGVMGIADMLIKLSISYGCERSLELCSAIAQVMAVAALDESCKLAERFGPYPMFNADAVLASEYCQRHTDASLVERIRRYGLCNSQLLTIAPTGSLSTMLGISGGIEPIYATHYTRTTKSLHGKDVTYKVYTPIVKRWIDEHGTEELPDYMVTAQTLGYRDRILMQGVWQRHIDASISSTVNVPNDFTVEDTEDLYLFAWETGLKGITMFRDGCKRAAILNTSSESKDKTDDIPDAKTDTKPSFDHIMPVARAEFGTTHGSTYLKQSACGKLYITINRDDDGNIVESFVHTSKGGICQAHSSALNRMVSLCMRSGVRLDEIADQLSGITCPACVKAQGKGAKIDGLSCPDIIARTLNEFRTIQTPKKQPITDDVKPIPEDKPVPVQGNEHCPDCGGTLIHEGGCKTCLNCGWSKCG